MNGATRLHVYIDNVDLLGEYITNIKENPEAPFVTSKEYGLQVNIKKSTDMYKSYSDKCTLFHVIQHNFLLKTAQHASNLFKVHLQGLIC